MILYQQDGLIVVNKPSKVVVHTTRGAEGRPLLQIVRDRLGSKVWPVHRLDAATSGALVFAQSSELAGQISARFQTREVKKHYVALVRGVVLSPGVIDNPVPREAGGNRVDAVTAYAPLWNDHRYSWLLLRPLTGRRHQIRRHLKHKSWPIIGDVRYGKGDHNRWFRQEYQLCRLALHAFGLEFSVQGGQRVSVRAPLPVDLKAPLLALGISEDVLNVEALPEIPLEAKELGQVGTQTTKEDCNRLKPED